MVEQWYYRIVQYVANKKSRITKNKKVKGLLLNLGIRTPLSKVSILGSIYA